LNPLDGKEPVFEAPWEAQAFAMAIKLHEQEAFTWPDFARHLAQAIEGAPRQTYFENWLTALENILTERQILGRVERLDRIEDWDRAAHATPHGQPIELIPTVSQIR
jgi:nitrile hydratase accessory protein